MLQTEPSSFIICFYKTANKNIVIHAIRQLKSHCLIIIAEIHIEEQNYYTLLYYYYSLIKYVSH